jgi:LuxR family maltose regulon positive regulatory protein
LPAEAKAESLVQVTSATTLDDDALSVAPRERLRVAADRPEPRFGAPQRRDRVERPRLITSLERAATRPLVLITAPAGYGKTTLLAQWAHASSRAFAWLRPEMGDHDPGRLSAAVTVALACLAAPDEPRSHSVLVLDDAHLIDSDVLQEVIPGLLGCLPEHCQLVLASRCEPALGLGGLRAEGLVFEVGPDELSMSISEAAALLRQAGLDLEPPAVAALVEQTGGWAVALELAAIAYGHTPSSEHRLPFSGDDHFLSEYFRTEILERLPAASVRFLARTSVLDRLSGPLCDAVLERRRSGALLAELERANVPLRPVDSSYEWYQLEPVFREMLQTELRRAEPDIQSALHRRASDWYEQAGQLDQAIDHARRGNDLQRTGSLLWANLPQYLGDGRNDCIQRWLSGVAPRPGGTPLALAAAHSHLSSGHVAAAEQWARCATASLSGAAEATTRTERASVLLVEAWVARSGARAMGDAAACAYELLAEDNPWRASCCFLRGSAALLGGDPATAEPLFQEGVARGELVAPDSAALCLAQLSVIAAEGNEPESASDFARRAHSIVTDHGLDGYPTCALVWAVCATDAIRERHADEAKAAASHCLGLLEALEDSVCWYGAEARILLAHVALSLGDVPGARTRLADASRLSRRTPDAALYARWFDAAWNQFDACAESALIGVATLTTAELRVLRFLPTHYSFQEIAQRLHVSSNTVKTHVHAVYRKLDACSRSQAVAHAIEAGLLSS